MKLTRLFNYLKMTEEQLYKVAHKELSRLDYAVYTNQHQEFIFAMPRVEEENSIPVLLVAHMDTVHTKPPKSVFFDEAQGVVWSPDGLGADDRAGVFAVLELAKRFKVSVLLTTGEESGGIGARSFINAYPNNIFGFKMAVQLDRCNTMDCVFYSNDSKEFHTYVEEFGFKKTYGSFSDISVIGPAWELNAVNLSVGFMSEHTSSEHLYVNALVDTINKVSILLGSDIQEFEYKRKHYGNYGRVYKFNQKYGNYYYDREEDAEFWREYDKKHGTTHSKRYDELDENWLDCMDCGELFLDSELVFVHDDTITLCEKCYKRDGFECGYCGEKFTAYFADIYHAAMQNICDNCWETYHLPALLEADSSDKK